MSGPLICIALPVATFLTACSAVGAGRVDFVWLFFWLSMYDELAEVIRRWARTYLGTWEFECLQIKCWGRKL